MVLKSPIVDLGGCPSTARMLVDSYDKTEITLFSFEINISVFLHVLSVSVVNIF